MNVKDFKFGILGMARSGLAAAYKIKQLGGNLFLSELKPEDKITNFQKIKNNFECEFNGHTEKILDKGIIIVSPGIPLDIPVLRKAKQ
ncbi:MAG: UDP-N-acetylmuramoyl-L-alanine--D-glutamate ligase, partial [Candidatus Cloacimonetes bacterium]|nr:UDP-N-acetylmuramoyl-L-alanine--D-glutamate ligase [Candidatus Cloacimonadota bacterium]